MGCANQRRIQVLREAGGWLKVFESFDEVHAAQMRRYSKRWMVLLIDFDNKEGRLKHVKNKIPADLADRVFVIGAWSNPESLRNETGMRLEAIGQELAKNCADNKVGLWNHELLKHNKAELERMKISVKPFLFVDGSC
jgi:hypothetical protein